MAARDYCSSGLNYYLPNGLGCCEFKSRDKISVCHGQAQEHIFTSQINIVIIIIVVSSSSSSVVVVNAATKVTIAVEGNFCLKITFNNHTCRDSRVLKIYGIQLFLPHTKIKDARSYHPYRQQAVYACTCAVTSSV